MAAASAFKPGRVRHRARWSRADLLADVDDNLFGTPDMPAAAAVDRAIDGTAQQRRRQRSTPPAGPSLRHDSFPGRCILFGGLVTLAQGLGTDG